MELPLEQWLDAILRVTNQSGASSPAISRLRKRLCELIGGRLPLRSHFRRALPTLFVGLSGKRLRVSTDLGPVTQDDIDDIEDLGYLPWLAARRGDQLEAAIYALSTSDLGARVRRCAYEPCGRFFVARRNHRRKHHFCCPEHRHAFGREHRDKKKWAQYMRGYRKHPRRRIRR